MTVGQIITASDVPLATGLRYEWPFPVEQTGSVWCLCPGVATPVPPMMPDSVDLVKAAGSGVPGSNGQLDDVTLTQGDRFLVTRHVNF